MKKILTSQRSRVLGDVPHPLTNFQIEAYYQNEPRFNGVFSSDNLPNNSSNNDDDDDDNNNNNNNNNHHHLDEYHDIGTH